MPTLYFPPCNHGFGTMGDRNNQCRCDGPPGHRGGHYDRERKIRWAAFGNKLARCAWSACSDPDRQMVDDEGSDTIHVCPGGEGERMFRDQLLSEGWREVWRAR